MKSRLDYNNKDNVYAKSKRMQRYEAYVQKLKSINDAVNGTLDNIVTLPEGIKVKLNYESLTTEPTYPKKTNKYKEFVEKNKDKIFTVQYDEKYKNKPVLVSFVEDTNKVKWLWHCENDLIVVDNVENDD